MHPKVVFPGKLAPIVEDLARPLHDRPRRNRRRAPDPETEVSLSGGRTRSL